MYNLAKGSLVSSQATNLQLSSLSSGCLPCLTVVSCAQAIYFNKTLLPKSCRNFSGAGARTSKKDGLPGFLTSTGVAVYKATWLKFDKKGRLHSFCGIGKTNTLTKVYINH
jgi:hypothetical protein